MDSFDEFSYGLNQKPPNTRSSVIESHTRYTEPVNSDLELITERSKAVTPSTTFTKSNQYQEMFKSPSIRYFQQKGGTYNSSGRPLHLSDFRNDMTSELYFVNDNSRTYGPSDSRLSQRDTTSNFQNSGLIPYDDSGRTFNLTEFRANNSNSPQHSTYTNDTSRQHLNASKGKQRRIQTQNADSSRIAFHYDPYQSLETYCCDFFQSSEGQQNECNVLPKRNGQNVDIKSTLGFQPRTRRNNLFETLVKDPYYPGIIVDSVNGLIDFNKIAFGRVFDCDQIPLEIDQESVPMTLLEAFDLRIQYEQDLRNDREKRKLFCSSELKNGQKEATIGNKDQEQKEDSENVTFWTHRDELKLASTIDIDLMSRLSNVPETPLTEAINCLLKAEKMNTFDRDVHLAEEAIRTASTDDQKELAALKSNCSFKLDLRKDETKTTNTFEPLAIISYIGTTKPNYNE